MNFQIAVCRDGRRAGRFSVVQILFAARRLGGRMRKTIIVALARKLLIALGGTPPPVSSSRGR
jgi:hypothetical protein